MSPSVEGFDRAPAPLLDQDPPAAHWCGTDNHGSISRRARRIGLQAEEEARRWIDSTELGVGAEVVATVHAAEAVPAGIAEEITE